MPNSDALARGNPGHSPSREVDIQTLAGLDLVHRPVWIVDPDALSFWWGNHAALDFWGVASLEEFRHLQCADLFPVGQGEMEALLRRLGRGETPTEQWQNGHRRLDCLHSGVLIERNRLAILVEGDEMPSQRSLVQGQRLRALELLRHCGAVSAMFDADGKLLFQNPAAAACCAQRTFFEYFTDPATGHLVWASVWRSGFYQSHLLLKTPTGDRWFAVEGRTVQDPLSGETILLWIGLDIDHQQRVTLSSRASLRDQEARLRAILASLSEGVVVHGAGGAVVEVNPAAREMLTTPEPTLIRSDGSLLPTTEHPATLTLQSGEPVQGMVLGLRQPDQSLETVRWVQVTSAPVLVGTRRLDSVVVTYTDITQLKRAELALALEKQRLEVTLRSIGDAVISADGEGRVEYLNPQAELLTGWTLDEARGRPLAAIYQLVRESDDIPMSAPLLRCVEGEEQGGRDDCVLVDRAGERRPIQDSVAPITDPGGRVEGVVLVFRDITEERLRQQEMHFQANHDALTGLPNRREFEQRLERVINDARTQGSDHVLCYLDLDRFKPVNDSCGHAAGDELLRQLAALFSSCCRKRDLLARLGGDEFGLLLEHCTLDQARRVVEELLAAVVGFRFIWEQQHFSVGASIGMVAITADSGDVRQLFRDADSACYRAKAEGGNRLHVYRPGDSQLAADYLAARMFTEGGESLLLEQLRLLAQPIVDRADGRWIGAELLLRWEDRDGRLHRPASFFGLAERQSLCARLDLWVVSEVCQWLTQQDRLGRDAPVCWINLFPQSLGLEDFAGMVVDILEQSAIDGRRLCFEIAENTLASQRSAVVAFMDRLRPLGCEFALDNCGGSSVVFSELRYLPLGYLKIQDRLVRESVVDAVARRVIAAVVDVAHLLNRRTVGLGVENAEALTQLGDLGLDAYQGFFLGEPQPPDSLLDQKP